MERRRNLLTTDTLGRCLRTSIVTSICALALATAAGAAPVVYDGFDYASGDLTGQTGGTGDWAGDWTRESDIQVLLGGWDYTDGMGNNLTTSGNHVGLLSPSESPEPVSRQLNATVGQNPETVWLSIILDGSATSSINNVGISDLFFVGQGGRDTGSLNWQLSDKDGLIADTGIAADARAFLVARIDFTAGDENVWLWVNPDLDTEPLLVNADAFGTAANFSADELSIRLQDSGTVGLDELRFGDAWTNNVVAPEPGTALLLGLGLTGLAASRRSSGLRR